MFMISVLYAFTHFFMFPQGFLEASTKEFQSSAEGFVFVNGQPKKEGLFLDHTCLWYLWYSWYLWYLWYLCLAIECSGFYPIVHYYYYYYYMQVI